MTRQSLLVLSAPFVIVLILQSIAVAQVGEMVWIPGGTFEMGDHFNERPVEPYGRFKKWLRMDVWPSEWILTHISPERLRWCRESYGRTPTSSRVLALLNRYHL